MHRFHQTIILKFTKQYGEYEKLMLSEVYIHMPLKNKSTVTYSFKVALQLPEGLMMFACLISDILET